MAEHTCSACGFDGTEALCDCPDILRNRIRELEQRLEDCKAGWTVQRDDKEAWRSETEKARARADAAEQRVTELVGLLERAVLFLSLHPKLTKRIRSALAPDSAPAKHPAAIPPYCPDCDQSSATCDCTSALPDEPPPIRPGAKCSNGYKFWCSLHCPLEHGPVNSGGKNCGGARALCSEHCAA